MTYQINKKGNTYQIQDYDDAVEQWFTFEETQTKKQAENIIKRLEKNEETK